MLRASDDVGWSVLTLHIVIKVASVSTVTTTTWLSWDSITVFGAVVLSLRVDDPEGLVVGVTVDQTELDVMATLLYLHDCLRDAKQR